MKSSFKNIYKVKMLCYDTPDCCNPYEDEPTDNILFDSYEKAYDYAKQLCIDEYLGLLEPDNIHDEFQKANLYSIIENREKKTIGVYFRECISDKFAQLTLYFVEKVCPYCSSNDFCMINDTKEYSGVEMAISSKGILRVRVEGEDTFSTQDILNISFCPICGKKFADAH